MNILLPVSGDPSFKDAVSLAIDVAKAHEGEIRIVYVIDQEEIRRIESGGGLGAIHMAQHAAEEYGKRKMEEATGILLETIQTCAQGGVQAHGEIREGETSKELLAAAGGCDLVAAAIASHFAPQLEDKPGRLVLSMMNDGGIPVLMACTPYRPVRTVVVGCGGKVKTERVVGAMTKLSLWKTGYRMILLAVDDSEEEGQMRFAASRNLLSDAGYPPWEERVVPGHRLETFSAFCEKENADLVVLGGWGEHRWDDLVGLSLTGRVLEEGRRNLFLYM
ncbi:MAG: universal stress protein [Deltaproteobacteria bacterium]|nr:universal stress protein [Deltaproteobacteria bacterium]